MHYFGTTLNESGHYFWTLEDSAIYRGGRHTLDFGKCPFNPESLPYKKGGGGYVDGHTEFYQFAGFSICAIAGSCKDTRPGSRSVFFVEDELDKEQLKALILATPIARRIVEKMPFEVKW